MEIFNYIVVIVCFFLLIINRGEKTFFKFIISVFSGFIISMHFSEYINPLFVNIDLQALSFISNFIPNLLVYAQSNAVTIFDGNNALSYFITIECSGVIETLVFLNFVVFFPVNNGKYFKKLGIAIVGLVYLIAVNILRILLMSGVVMIFGVESFFIAHVLISRLFFIGMNILLYYFVFTLPHVKNQKAGQYTESHQIG